MSLGKVFIAGHKGMVGSSIYRLIKERNLSEKIITISKSDLDLTVQSQVYNFLNIEKPKTVVIASAKVGGIMANSNFPAEFIFQNLMIECNLIHGSYLNGVNKILFLGSSCIYPKDIDGSMKEDMLLSGHLEPTNEPYSIAKISGIKLCESYNRQYGTDFRSVMPSNLYGPGDKYDEINSHVIPALIQKFHNAKIKNMKEIIIWGSGKPMREFLYVEDLANACVKILEMKKNNYNQYVSDMCSHINIGYGSDISIHDLAKLIASIVGYEGNIEFDTSKPDGIKKKLLDSSIIQKMGWKAEVNIKDGINFAYKDYLKRLD